MHGSQEATDCDSVSDDSLQGLRGNLQQGANSSGLSLADDVGHLKGVSLKQHCDI